MSLKMGSSSVLSPAAEHPLQDIDSPSPSPIRPMHTGSTSALYTSFRPVSIRNQKLIFQRPHSVMKTNKFFVCYVVFIYYLFVVSIYVYFLYFVLILCSDHY